MVLLYCQWVISLITSKNTYNLEKVIKYLLSQFRKWQISLVSTKKIKKIKASLNTSGLLIPAVSTEISVKHEKLWNGYGTKINTDWLRVYISISGINDFRFIPENIYYSEIEPRLNNKTFSKAYTDKNSYHRIIRNDVLPEILLRSISGIFYTQDYMRIENANLYFDNIEASRSYIIKPSIEGGGGLDVRRVEFTGKQLIITPVIDGISSIEELFKYYKRDFVIQEYVKQHSFYYQFNSSSLNTVRILTYRSLRNEEIVILQRVFRIGRPGSIVDNQASGGIACGINSEGILSNFGVDKSGNKHFESGSCKFERAGKLQSIESIDSLAIELAGNFRYSRLLGMDFAVDVKGKVLLIEINDSSNEINFYQMNNGPLFGDKSEEVADFCKREPKSFLIDFNL